LVGSYPRMERVDTNVTLRYTMGRFRGKRTPDEYCEGYSKVEGQEEHWYWYMAGYEDGLLDDYNRQTPASDEIRRLQQDVSSLLQQAAARERVLESYGTV